MTPERLADIESRYTLDRDNSFGADHVRELIAALREARSALKNWVNASDIYFADRASGKPQHLWQPDYVMKANADVAWTTLKLGKDGRLS